LLLTKEGHKGVVFDGGRQGCVLAGKIDEAIGSGFVVGRGRKIASASV